MRSGRVPRAPDQRDDSTCLDVLALAHQDFGGVGVVVAIVAVIDDHQFAVAALPTGVGDGAGCSGVDGITCVAVEVEAGAEVRSADARGAVAEPRGDGADQRPVQSTRWQAGSHARVGDSATRSYLGSRQDAQLLSADEALVGEVVGTHDGCYRRVVRAGQRPQAVALRDNDHLGYGPAAVGIDGSVLTGNL